MKAETTKKLESFLDRLAEECEALLESDATAGLRQILQELSAAAPEFAFDLLLTLQVGEESHRESLRLLTTGYSTAEGREPYVCYGDSTLTRYVVNGEICQVPHDQCPNCWSLWDVKMKHRTCSGCGLSLGREVKILLDSDVCPNCEEGKVTLQEPACTKCDFVVDGDVVTWG